MKTHAYVNGITINNILNLQQQSPDENIYLGKITVSPQHAKQLAYLLLNYIKQYEEIFGEIPSPPSEEKIQKLSELGIIEVKSE